MYDMTKTMGQDDLIGHEYRAGQANRKVRVQTYRTRKRKDKKSGRVNNIGQDKSAGHNKLTGKDNSTVMTAYEYRT